MKKLILMVAVAMAMAGSAFAGLTYNASVSVTKSGNPGELLTGTGIANGGFVVDNSNGIELGLKAHTDYLDSMLPNDGKGLYFAQPGSNRNTGAGNPMATWNFVYSVNLGSRTLADTLVSLTINNTPFVFNGLVPANTAIMQDSSDLAWWFVGSFNPNANGLYNFVLTARELTGAPLAQSEMAVQVGAVTVPAPGALLLSGLGTGLVGWLRKRKA